MGDRFPAGFLGVLASLFEKGQGRTNCLDLLVITFSRISSRAIGLFSSGVFDVSALFFEEGQEWGSE